MEKSRKKFMHTSFFKRIILANMLITGNRYSWTINNIINLYIVGVERVTLNMIGHRGTIFAYSIFFYSCPILLNNKNYWTK